MPEALDLHLIQYIVYITCNEILPYNRLLFEMYRFWPESWTFRDSKDLDFEEYRETIKEPIALDMIKSRLIEKGPNQVGTISSWWLGLKLFYKV